MNEANCLTEMDNFSSQMDEFFDLPATSVKHNITIAKVNERIDKLFELYQIQNGGINSMEFCGTTTGDCARTTPFMARTKGSSGHLRVSKVENEDGPQTTGIDPGCPLTIPNTYGYATPTVAAMSPTSLPANCPVPPAFCSDVKKSTSPQTDVKHKIMQQHIPQDLQERITASEAALNITASDLADLYERQKNIETLLLQMKNVATNPMLPPSDASGQESYPDDMSMDDVNEEIWSLKTSIKHKKLKKAFGEY